MNAPTIAEINKDTFWALIDEAKEHPGNPYRWLMDLGPEQAKRFDDIAYAYSGLAYQYGLWTAASVMSRGGCTDGGFVDFRGWLIAQGREVYMAALKDPDSLAGARDYSDQRLDCLPRMGRLAYEELTGRSTYEDYDPAEIDVLKAELKKDIVCGEGVGYPYTWSETADYLPRLCSKYMTQEHLARLIETHNDTWNMARPKIKEARALAPKSKKVKKNRGDTR